MMTEQCYKAMSIKEFTKATEIYDSGHAGLEVKKLDKQKGFRMHLLAEKRIGLQ